jgi:hypothetical protein
MTHGEVGSPREAQARQRTASSIEKNKVRATLNGAEIPTDLADVIKQCWPHSIVEEFGADESYFNEIRWMYWQSNIFQGS